MFATLAGLVGSGLGKLVSNVASDIKTGKVHDLSTFGSSLWEGTKKAGKETINEVIPGIDSIIPALKVEDDHPSNHAIGKTINSLYSVRDNAVNTRAVVVPTQSRPIFSNSGVEGRVPEILNQNNLENVGQSSVVTPKMQEIVNNEPKVASIEVNKHPIGMGQSDKILLSEDELAAYKKLKRKHRKHKRTDRKKNTLRKTKEWK
jgi:hypothetical protein